MARRATALGPDKNLGTRRQAAELASVDEGTIYSWLRKGLIRGVRVGQGRIRYDLDSVAAMIIEYPRDDVDQRIRELVEAAPEFTPAQVNRIRLLLHATPQGAA